MKKAVCLVFVVLVLLFAITIPGYARDGGGGYYGGVAIMVAASGLDRDGADGLRGGGARHTIGTIHTIRIIRTRWLSSNSSLKHISSPPLNQQNSITGISARIPRATILT
ncbi:MAG: hypothetical protein ACLPX5_11000 [Dissulfurispiraceae bacterium]